MSSRLTMILAVALFAGALAAGYWGVVLSKPKVAPELASEQPQPAIETVSADSDVALDDMLNSKLDEAQRSTVIVLARDVKAFSQLQEADLLEEQLKIAPPGSFSDVSQLLGKVVWRDLPAGSLLNTASLESAGPLARMIRPDERALAIDVDEVTSAGGHLQPGDYVDVLLFLREDERNSDRTVQVVVPALRVLSVGAALGASSVGEPLMEIEKEDDANRARARRAEQARTVVLAIPESLQSRFMLATQVGTLRLAVRSVDEKLLAAYQTGTVPSAEIDELKRQLFQFEKLAVRQARRPQAGLVAPRPAGIPVYSGRTVSRQHP